MTVTAGQILTVETIPKYLEERLDDLKGIIDSVEGIQVETIAGGNVNYAFCITPNSKSKSNSNSNQKIFLKQAPEFVAIFGPDGFPLSSDRMQREMDVYQEWRTMLNKDGDGDGDGSNLGSTYLPNIHYFDKSHMVVIMQFLEGYELLDHILVGSEDGHGKNDDDTEEEKIIHVAIATALGDFMGKTHALTHSTKVSAERKEYLTTHFENRAMRDIQLEFVFTKCYKEATNEQRAGLQVTPEFLEQVELLKQQYNNNNNNNGTSNTSSSTSISSLVLTHGDLHPGSVMVDTKNGSTKVIDPEFTVYGPAGLDVGSLLSGYCLGAIHQAYSNNPKAVERIVDGAQVIWATYVKAMVQGGLTQDMIKEIEIETVGFTVAEVCRTALEFAGGRKWLQFEDVSVKAAAKKAALQVVDKCMIARHTGGIELLFQEMKKASILEGEKQ